MKKAKLIVPAEIDYLTIVRDFITRQGKNSHLSSQLIGAMKLAVEEACTNIICHGYKNVIYGKIKVKTIINQFNFKVIIYDQGISFDPRQVSSPDLKQYVEIGKIGGLGILMIRRLVDVMDYKVTINGNEFHLTKYREELKQNKLFQLWYTFRMYMRRLLKKCPAP